MAHGDASQMIFDDEWMTIPDGLYMNRSSPKQCLEAVVPLLPWNGRRMLRGRSPVKYTLPMHPPIVKFPLPDISRRKHDLPFTLHDVVLKVSFENDAIHRSHCRVALPHVLPLLLLKLPIVSHEDHPRFRIPMCGVVVGCGLDAVPAREQPLGKQPSMWIACLQTSRIGGLHVMLSDAWGASPCREVVGTI